MSLAVGPHFARFRSLSEIFLMGIRDEIAALRAEIEARRGASVAAAGASTPLDPKGMPAEGISAAQSADSFLRMFSETLDELPSELDRYPRLTAFAAFGIGLTLGAIIGRPFR
jgi:hypothetical protein